MPLRPLWCFEKERTPDTRGCTGSHQSRRVGCYMAGGVLQGGMGGDGGPQEQGGSGKESCLGHSVRKGNLYRVVLVPHPERCAKHASQVPACAPPVYALVPPSSSAPAYRPAPRPFLLRHGPAHLCIAVADQTSAKLPSLLNDSGPPHPPLDQAPLTHPGPMVP